MTEAYKVDGLYATVKMHYSNYRFKIEVSNEGLHWLIKWLEANNITEYEIVELLGYIVFYNHKDAVVFRMSTNNELLDNELPE